MAIQKQEFYEGAALHQLIRGCGGAKIAFVAPFFELNDRFRVHLKYSTGVRSPWGFTFMPEEQRLLASEGEGLPIVMGLCAARMVWQPFHPTCTLASLDLATSRFGLPAPGVTENTSRCPARTA
jgi:hypothetical protein